MSIWGTSVRGEVSKGTHALVFEMNTARLEPEGFLQRLTPKNLFLFLKQLQLLKIQLLLFLAQLLLLDMLLLPYPLPLVHLYSLGRVQGHTHTLPKPRVENLIFLMQELGCRARSLPSNATSSMRQKRDGLRMTRHSKKEGKRLQVHMLAYQTGKTLLLCTVVCSLA